MLELLYGVLLPLPKIPRGVLNNHRSLPVRDAVRWSGLVALATLSGYSALVRTEDSRHQ